MIHRTQSDIQKQTKMANSEVDFSPMKNFLRVSITLNPSQIKHEKSVTNLSQSNCFIQQQLV